VRFYDGLFLSFFNLQRCFFFMLFLQEENAAKAEKNDDKNDILNHKNQRNQFWTASSKSFSESYIVLFKSHAARRFIKRNHALDRAVFAKYATLSRPKFRALGIIDSTLHSVFAGPVRLNARPFKTLPAPSIWPNLDDRLRLLRGTR